MQDIENLGAQINNFYEKFGEVQNELVAFEDEYEMLKEEKTLQEGIPEPQSRGNQSMVDTMNSSISEIFSKADIHPNLYKRVKQMRKKRKERKSREQMSPIKTIVMMSNITELQTDLNIDLMRKDSIAGLKEPKRNNKNR